MLIKTERDAAGRKKSNGGAEEPKKKKRKATQGWASRLRPTKMARAIPALLGDTLSRIHFDRLRVQVEFGLGDPADTGRAFGQLVPLAFLPIGPAMSFDLRPNFEDRCLKGEVDLALHFIPAWLALPAIRFAWQQFVVRS